jgi:prepilin-type N-terminal cleavage/methylation domain-containing protein
MRHGAAGGYTLLELLLVAAILAIVAGAVLLTYEGADETAMLRVARTELTEVRKAILQFRHDTGYLPKTGPFDLVGRGGLIDPTVDADWPLEAPGNAAERIAWFDSPANFYQLFGLPAAFVSAHNLRFDPNTGHGYRGPYLTRHGEGWVKIGNSLQRNGNGDPASGSVIGPMPGVADPFPRAPPSGDLFSWTDTALAAGATSLELGRPLLYFIATGPPCLVCLGPNGEYDSSAAGINTVSGGDDLAVYLEP